MKTDSPKRIYAQALLRLFVVAGLLVTMISMPQRAVRAAGTVRFVKTDGAPLASCNSWANACTLDAGLSGAGSGDELWVKAGTYYPTTGADRSATFQLKNGVAVYGGFAGDESSLKQRDPTVNLTTLSGDIGSPNQTADNSYHVVTASGTDNTTLLDGFTIKAGNADGDVGNLDNIGGGMFIENGSPKLYRIIFARNTAEYGGGMYADNSSSVLSQVSFEENDATQNGGAMYNGDNSNLTLTNVAFMDNTANTFGAGVYNSNSSLTMNNTTFYNNNAVDFGGGMFNYNGNVTLSNVTFSSNSGGADGGGIYNYTSSLTLSNVTFSGNSSYYGGGIYNDISSPQISNTIFWGNTASIGAQIENYDVGSTPGVSDSVVQDGCPAGSTCTNIITADPLLGTLGDYGGFTQTIPILPGSSAIDTANDATCPATDQRGVTRPQGAHCDVGAFEFVPYTISGSAGVAGATLSYTDGTPRTATADGSGNYSFTVSYNWSGTVTPSKIGYVFSPVDTPYSNVVGDQTNQNYTATAVATFADVPTSYWAWNYIERLYHAGITGGCGTSPLIYCPDNSVTRAQMAIFLERGMNGSSYTPPAGTGTVFGDVPISYWDAAWIEKLAADGITGGCGGGNYCPGNPVTRAQMAIFLLRAEHGSSYTPPAATGTVFGDVPISYWDAAWIERLYAEGITGGCGGGNYCPATSVTRAQMAIFLVRTFNLP